MVCVISLKQSVTNLGQLKNSTFWVQELMVGCSIGDRSPSPLPGVNHPYVFHCLFCYSNTVARLNLLCFLYATIIIQEPRPSSLTSFSSMFSWSTSYQSFTDVSSMLSLKTPHDTFFLFQALSPCPCHLQSWHEHWVADTKVYGIILGESWVEQASWHRHQGCWIWQQLFEGVELNSW